MVVSLEDKVDIGEIVKGGVMKRGVGEIKVDEDRLLDDLDKIYGTEEALKYFDIVKKQLDYAQKDGKLKLRNIQPQWRKYIVDFLELDEPVKAILQQQDGASVLFVDDLDTTGATIAEVARLVKELAPECDMYSYTFCKSTNHH